MCQLWDNIVCIISPQLTPNSAICNNIFVRKLLVLSGFFLGTPLFIFLCIAYLSFLSYGGKEGKVLGASTQGIAYAALPPEGEIIQNEIQPADAKTEIVRQFFAKYNSPLEPYAPDIVAAADRYDMDFRLLPAIAMQESTLCRRVIAGSNNCWGFGIHGGKVTKFSNYPEAIETITKTLATKYRANGLVTPQEIAQMYNPSNTNHWVENVTSFMDDLK